MDILVVDDERAIRENTTFILESDDHYVEAVDNGQVALMRLKEEDFDLVLLDLRLGDENGLDILQEIQKKVPNTDVIVFTAYATVETAVKAIHLGAFDYIEKPFKPDTLRSALTKLTKHQRLKTRIEDLEVQVSSHTPDPTFDSADPSMKGAYDVLFRAADTSASILILGESGTGKSIVARAIHDRSHLKNKPFVTVSCPSLSKELLESELFGHVKGSFTGAIKDQWGKVHQANGGTLFLDEIGELPMDIQPKLLRLLQEREYERLGENKTRQADVRIIAATNRDLKEMVEEGTFREDLYYRLHVIAVEMPPLRSRPADLVNFATNFVDFFAKDSGRKVEGLSEQALAAVTAYHWPGNLRELRNAIERAVILCQGNRIEPGDLAGPVSTSSTSKALNGNDDMPSVGADVSLEELEEAHIRLILSRAPSMAEAANILGIDQATLYRKRKRLGLQ